MDPTISVPAHFTLEILSVVAAGLVLAWAVYGARWIAAAGALSYAVAQGLHAGSFITSDKDAVIVVLRLAGIAAIAIGTYNLKVRRELFFSGLGLLLGGAIWGAIVGGSAASLTVGPHVMAAVGAIVVLAWTWFASRPSVRLRLLVSFVLVLGVAVIVTGGSVSRVAAVEKRDEEYGKLGPTAVAVRQQVGDIATDLATRAATSSPQIATRVTQPSPTLTGVSLRSGEFAVLLGNGTVLATVSNGVDSFDLASTTTNDALSAAAAGSVATAYRILPTSDGLGAIGVAPVFRPGGQRSASDVIAVLALVRVIPIGTMQSFVTPFAADAKVAVGDASGAHASTIESSDIVAAVRTPTGPVTRTIETPTGRWPAVVTPLADASGVNLMIALPAIRVVDATRTLVRSFLIALLASALLAVVVALWLSARITRPMLDLVDEGERLKTDFLASVSHELRTPLTPIRGYTEILRRGRVPARRASGYLDEIGQAAQRLERIVSLLVDVAAIEAGRFHINLDDVPANELAEDAAKRWMQDSPDHPIVVDAADDLPAVKADDVAIGRVLDELIDNAIKFSPDGSTITVGAELRGRGVTFSVRDQGQGIEPERLAELGGAFEQIDSGDTRRFGGLGLGLNYARGVLAKHDSRLELTSEPGAGTTSSFTLAAAGIVTRMSPKATRSRKAPKTTAR